jgi:hypothetical protein
MTITFLGALGGSDIEEYREQKATKTIEQKEAMTLTQWGWLCPPSHIPRLPLPIFQRGRGLPPGGASNNVYQPFVLSYWNTNQSYR